MNNIEIANKHRVSKSFITMLLDPKRYNKFTNNLPLAYDLAKKSGKRPVSFMPKRWRKVIIEAHPEMGVK